MSTKLMLINEIKKHPLCGEFIETKALYRIIYLRQYDAVLTSSGIEILKCSDAINALLSILLKMQTVWKTID